ncbi:MAG: transcriptional regulator [Flavobacterium sp.]|nr:MAG: transcriptional regulator [Flavobacterium sp.]
MNKRIVFSVIGFVIVLFSIWFFVDTKEENNDFSEKVKVSLREVGHQLLLSNQDSTSLVLPVIKLTESKYQLKFENTLSFEPSLLVATVKKTFQNSGFDNSYFVEVSPCDLTEVSYSYEMKNLQGKSIIPCRSRVLPKNCYVIEVKFTDMKPTANSATYLYILAIIAFIGFQFLFYKKKQPLINITNSSNKEVSTEKYQSLGIFHFYPNQNKLVKESDEINLSKKECEILAIFIEKPNQIIKREELMKRVWEDNGVIVGRSLDTYVSKLRKKLKADTSIKISNVHGVGYKLELGN